MKHARPDYARIQDPHGLIPADEPVFLLRGQDLAAPSAVRAWARRAKEIGASQEIVDMAIDQAGAMEDWAAQMRVQFEGGGIPGKVPDLPHDPTEETDNG